jgi:hypothetical protein
MKTKTRLCFLALTVAALGCGKKGPPLPPFRPDPLAPSELKVGQEGDKLSVAYVTPRQTVDQQRLDVHDIEVLVATRTGELAKVAEVHRLRAAPGESRTETYPLPQVGTTVRVAVRARSKGRPSPSTRTAVLKVQPPPPVPESVAARLEGTGVRVTWNPAPLPTATAPPTPAPVSGEGAASLTPTATATPRPTPSGPTGYQVRRRGPAGVVAWVTEKPVPLTAILDDGIKAGGRWCYTVRSVVSWDPLLASAESPEACVEVVLPH